MTEQELEQMEANEDGNHPCPKCGIEIPNARAVLLKVMTCKECTPERFVPKAVFTSDEREGEGGTYVVCYDEKGFKEAKRSTSGAATKEEDEASDAIETGDKMNADS